MNKVNWKQVAPFSLYLAIAAALVAVGLYVVMREWNIYLQISLALVVVGLAGFVLMDPARTRRIFTGRQARYGSNSLLLSLAFLGIVIVLNYVAYKNPKNWDLTEDKTNTLLQETLDTLQQLPEPVKALAFYQSNQSTETVQQLLDKYKSKADGKFDYEFIDPLSNPAAAKAANVSTEGAGVVVLTMGDKQEKVTFASEDQVTNALVRLMADKPAIYFLKGHGEASLDGTGELAFGEAKTAMESKGYVVNELDLLAETGIPQDARAIIIAGPQSPLAPEEMVKITAFVEQGGALVVMEEPTLLTRMKDQTDPLAEYLLNSWGISLGNDIIIDTNFENPFQTVAYDYTANPIVDKIVQANLSMAFLFSRSVKVASQVENVTTVEMLRTTPQSWAETDLASMEAQQEPSFDQNADIPGPVPLAVSADNTATGSRVVVIGDVHFAVDGNFTYLGNGDLFINSIDWVTEQENLMNLTPRETTSRMMITPSKYMVGLIVLGTVIVIPGLVIAAGIAAFILRRRHS
jgi:ABC-type uncharacterized transport system involved in gliding motility auxiliary subunit